MVKRKKEKLGFRQRFHFWWCDHLNVMSFDDFLSFYEDLMPILDKVEKAFAFQNEFNKMVGDRLGLENDARLKMDENCDRGMVQ